MKKPVALLAAAMMATVPLALSANQASATHVFWHAAAGGFVGGVAGGARETGSGASSGVGCGAGS